MDSPPVENLAKSSGASGATQARPRIAVLPERYGNVLSPCASIRLYSYFDRLRRSGHADIRFVLPSELERFAPDMIVWHRISLPDVAKVQWLHALAQRIHARTIYDLDDNLLDMQGHDEQESYSAMTAAVRESLACADEVWCSTPDLGRRIAMQGRGRIQVLPNTLDPELWGLERPSPSARHPDSPLRLLYMGTRTHDQDYAFLHQVMEALHEQMPGAMELSLIGVRSRDDDCPPWLRVLSPPPHVGASYPAFVHWLIQQEGFDIGLAPLLANPFNNCKSPIKVLDYAAIGLPTLASDMPAYTHSLTHDVDCFHAVNQVEAWQDMLQNLITQPERRQRVCRNAMFLVNPAVFQSGVVDRLSLIHSLLNQA
jgi:glycosyltransferase involved in cell wall biosynthesis